MPTYEYACRSCGQHLEVVQSFKDDALTECPSCQGELRKVFSAAGIIFKGSGWHVKDYASGSKSAGAGSSTSSSDDGGSSSSDSDAAATSSSTKDGATPSSATTSSSSTAAESA